VSVSNQNYSPIELIVIDGESIDHSLKIISEYSSKIQFCVSEKDTGIYNAMNKGVKLSTGKWLMFLNSGDILNGSDAIDLFVKNKFDEELVYCDVLSNVDDGIISYPDNLTFNYFFRYSLNHQSTFFRRQLFDKYGMYNEKYKIVSDWEFFLRIIFLKNISVKHFSYPVVVFDFNNGISTNSNNKELIEKERRQVLFDLFPRFYDDYLKLNAYQASFIIKVVSRLLNIFLGKN
jgi:glycosyltransferase involved in cell wall biosynthesis